MITRTLVHKPRLFGPSPKHRHNPLRVKLRNHRDELLATLLSLAMVGGVALTAQNTAQAVGANPYAEVSLIKMSDGTGHGTPAQTFITSANGYAVGDNTPTDGVVASYDTVSYDIKLAFSAFSQRVIAVNLDIPPYLEWPTSGDTFCTSGRFVTAQRSGNTCYFTVPYGAVESLSRTLTLVAKDTGGLVVPNQVLSATYGIRNDAGGTYGVARTSAVTVVSAPRADVVVAAPPFTSMNNNSIRYGSPINWTSGATSGKFVATPTALRYPGSSSSKGVSTSALWWGTFDVSSFSSISGDKCGDPGTAENPIAPVPCGQVTWTISGIGENGAYNNVPVTPNASGLITIPKSSGPVTIQYNLPAGWPQQNFGSVDYPVRVNVAPGSFEASGAGAMPNNGNSSQPGDNQPATFNTGNVPGAIAGSPFPNNDWTVARVNRTEPVTGEIFNKTVYAPRDSGYTLWEDPNKFEAVNERLGVVSAPYPYQPAAGRPVAPGTELTNQITVLTNNILTADWNQEQIIVGDVWNKAECNTTLCGREQFLDITRSIRVLGPVGEINPGLYVFQWSTQEKTPEQVANLADPGWNTGMPADDTTARTVKSFRFVFAVNALPTGTEPGAGTHIIYVPTKLAEIFDPADSGKLIVDTASIGFSNLPNVTVSGQLYFNAGVEVRLPQLRNLEIDAKITAVGGERNNLAQPTVKAGQVISYQLDPFVDNLLATSETATDPIVVVTLDKCLSVPVNTSGYWNMVVTGGIPGPSGQICGDSGSTPYTLTFTFNGDADPAAPGIQATMSRWRDANAGNGALPPINFTAKSSAIMPLDTTNLTVGAVFRTAETDAYPDPRVASDDVMASAAWESGASSVLTEQFQVTDTNSPLVWKGQIYSDNGQPTSTMIILPRCGGRGTDTGMFTQNVAGHYGEAGHTDPFGRTGNDIDSDCSGTYTVTSAILDPEQTSLNAQLFFTTDPSPVFDGTYNWQPVTSSTIATYGSQITAFMVSLPYATNAVNSIDLEITLQPTGNKMDDIYYMWMSQGVVPPNQAEWEATWNAWFTQNCHNNENDPVACVGGAYKPVPQPYPRPIVVKESLISGTVWWDESDDGSLNDDEPRIDSVLVTLHQANNDGTYDPNAVLRAFCTGGGEINLANMTVTPGSYQPGYYEFAHLHSGSYVTVVHKNPTDIANSPCTQVIPPAVETQYRQNMNVDETYSWQNKYFSNSRVNSDLIKLPIGAEQRDVDYGFYNPDPSIALDKSKAEVVCANGICTVTWEVTVTNTGNVRLSDIEFTDTLTGDPTSVEVIGIERPNYLAPVMGAGADNYVYPFAIWPNGNQVYGWGNYIMGQLGVGGTCIRNCVMLTPALNALSSEVDIAQVAVGSGHTLALNTAGQLYVWGAGSNGVLGLGNTSNSTTPTPIPMASFTADGQAASAIVYVAAGALSSFAIDDLGRLWAWGQQYGPQGFLGSGTTTFLPVPTLLSQPGLFDNLKVKAVSSSGFQVNTSAGHTLVIDENGDLWAMGQQTNGKLGDGVINSSTSVTIPTKINPNLFGGAKFTAVVAAGGDRSFALDVNGHVWAWGKNSINGDLGVGNGVALLGDPVAIPQQLQFGGRRIVEITSVSGGGLALDENGQVWVWGTNDDGIGLGAIGVAAVPALIPSTSFEGNRIVAIGGGPTSNAYSAVDALGQVWMWGGRGAIGAGDSSYRTTPTKIGVRGAVQQTGALAPIRTDATSKTYAASLEKGESTSYLVRATYPQPSNSDGNRVVVNQAWVTSPLTPIAQPNTPQVPAPGVMNPIGTDTNPTCDTDHPFYSGPPDLHHPAYLGGDVSNVNSFGLGGDDGCDEVPALLTPTPAVPGAITGVVWIDANGDGVRQNGETLLPGVTVTLFQNGSGTPVATTTTNSSGAFRFDNVYEGDYYVVFTPATATQQPANGAWAFTVQEDEYVLDGAEIDSVVDSDAYQSGNAVGSTPVFHHPSGGVTSASVDAGVIEISAAIDVDKRGGLPGDLEPDEYHVALNSSGLHEPLTVQASFTNTGAEPLTHLHLQDATVSGPAVENWTCTVERPVGGSTQVPLSVSNDGYLVITSTGDELVLAHDNPATANINERETVTCVGSLGSAQAGRVDADNPHADVFGVSGTGAYSNQAVNGTDPWQANAEPEVPGAITGIVWVDANRDGARSNTETDRLAGVTVILYDGAGQPVNSTSTDAYGEFRFDGVYEGDYYIGYSLNGVTPPAGGGVWDYTVQLGTDVISPDDGDDDSDAEQNGAHKGRTPVFHHPYGGVTSASVDAGVVAITPAISVTKTGGIGNNQADPYTVALDGAGQHTPLTVTAAFTNTGSEPLTHLTWTDTTISPPAVTGWVCSVQRGGSAVPVSLSSSGATSGYLVVTSTGAELVLANDEPATPGDERETVTCTGTLGSTGSGWVNLFAPHQDMFSVTGGGVISGFPVSGEDPWTAQTQGRPLTFRKTNLTGDPLDGAQFVIYADTNNGTGTFEQAVAAGRSYAVTGFGDGTVTVPNIVPGSYWLEETRAPLTWRLLGHPVRFVVTADWQVQIPDPDPLVTGCGTNDCRVVTVADARMALPFVGGSGAATWWTTIAGLIGVAGTVTALKRRTRRIPRHAI